MRWCVCPRAPAGVLLALSLVISGCDRPEPPAGLLASADARQAGATTFAANCAICHGDDADGRGPRREGIDPPPTNLTLPPWSEPAHAAQTYRAIRDGVPGTAMPAWRTLGERRIWELVAHITAAR
jgi:mono/diheme cytochrome c family protein